MEISALTRSVVKRNHALIAPDGYINSRVPGLEDCTVNVILNEQMGARLCQTIITCTKDTKIAGKTADAQVFFYVIQGKCMATVNGASRPMDRGHFVYVPVGGTYHFDQTGPGAQLLSFHKTYEKLGGSAIPGVLFGDAANV